MTVQDIDRATFAADWAEWHRQHEAALAGRPHVLFTDATSGVTTYPASRSLQVDAPDQDGTVTLDFNRAVNLPARTPSSPPAPFHPPGTASPSPSKPAPPR